MLDPILSVVLFTYEELRLNSWTQQGILTKNLFADVVTGFLASIVHTVLNEPMGTVIFHLKMF